MQFINLRRWHGWLTQILETAYYWGRNMQSTQGFDDGSEVYRNFIQSLKAERTRISYRDALSRYMQFMGVDSVEPPNVATLRLFKTALSGGSSA